MGLLSALDSVSLILETFIGGGKPRPWSMSDESDTDWREPHGGHSDVGEARLVGMEGAA